MTEKHVKDLASIIKTYNGYFRHELDPYNTKRGKLDKRRRINKKHYPFIPSYDIKALLECYESVFKYFMEKRRTSKSGKFLNFKFLDAGCGIGNNLLLASQVGFEPYGIEYDRKTFKIAQTLMYTAGISKSAIIRGDITEHDKYHKYDLIYFYIPISEVDKQTKFVKKLVDGAKVGAIIIGNGGSNVLTKDKRFKVPKIIRKYGNIREKIKK